MNGRREMNGLARGDESNLPAGAPPCNLYRTESSCNLRSKARDRWRRSDCDAMSMSMPVVSPASPVRDLEPTPLGQRTLSRPSLDRSPKLVLSGEGIAPIDTTGQPCRRDGTEKRKEEVDGGGG